ncbi:MAG: extracellular solute-binding protein [Pseudoflavonifractor sp.]
MKKKLALLLAVAMTVSLLASCGNQAPKPPASQQPSGTPGQVQPTSDAPKEKVTVTYMTESTLLPLKVDEINQSLQKTLPHITLDIIHVADNYGTTVKSKFATGDPPDLFDWPGYTAITPFVEAGYVLDITDTGYVDSVIDTFRPCGMYEGKVYGLPTQVQANAMIYNIDCFEKAGIAEPPKTLTELKDACEKLKAVGIIPFATGFKEAWVGNQTTWKFLSSGVGDYQTWYDAMMAGTGSFKNDKTYAAFELMDIILANTVDMPLSSDAANMSHLLGTGQAAITFLGEFQYDAIAKSNPDVRLAMAPTPVSEDPADAFMEFDGQQIIFSAAASKHTDAIKEVLGWFSSEEGARTISTLSKQGSAFNYDLSDVDLNPLGQSSAEYIRAGGNTVAYIKNFWPAGLTGEAGKILQNYISGTIDKDQFFTDMDEAFQRLAAQQ